MRPTGSGQSLASSCFVGCAPVQTEAVCGPAPRTQASPAGKAPWLSMGGPPEKLRSRCNIPTGWQYLTVTGPGSARCPLLDCPLSQACACPKDSAFATPSPGAPGRSTGAGRSDPESGNRNQTAIKTTVSRLYWLPIGLRPRHDLASPGLPGSHRR
jgi:hypothetical protein